MHFCKLNSFLECTQHWNFKKLLMPYDVVRMMQNAYEDFKISLTKMAAGTDIRVSKDHQPIIKVLLLYSASKLHSISCACFFMILIIAKV